jgi:hypothetical protein
LVERVLGKDEVTSSILVIGSRHTLKVDACSYLSPPPHLGSPPLVGA